MIKHALRSPNGVLSTFDCLYLADYGGNMPLPVDHTFDSGELWPDNFPSSYNNDQFDGWFYLASLQHLEIWLRDTTEIKKSSLKLNLDRLKTLIFSRSTIYEDDVFSFLTQTQSLKNLHIGLAYPWRKPCMFENSEIFVQALESVKNTVTNLSIGFEYYPHCLGECHEGDEQPHLLDPFKGVFKKFANLQTAELPIQLLVGFDPYEEEIDLGEMLPDTLWKLVLRNDLGNIMEYEWGTPEFFSRVNRFVTKSLRSVTPHLQHICLRFTPLSYNPFYYPDKKKVVTSVAKETGLTLRLLLMGFQPDSLFQSHNMYMSTSTHLNLGLEHECMNILLLLLLLLLLSLWLPCSNSLSSSVWKPLLGCSCDNGVIVIHGFFVDDFKIKTITSNKFMTPPLGISRL